MKDDLYRETARAIESMTDGETDRIAVMSTIACELFHAFDHFNWVGFYRRVDTKTLKVGPYQGAHGCLTIDVTRGVCGKCVREAEIQVVNDVSAEACHIACSPHSRAEIVLPIFDRGGEVCAVLDIDSTRSHVFDDVDVKWLEKMCCRVADVIRG
jgi:L-methionine (R)-S-oxide reductase